MRSSYLLSLAVALTVVSGAAVADHYPGMADLMAPGGEFTGTPDYGKKSAQAAKAKRCFADFDTNADGALDSSELGSDSQLGKRLSTRDANRDGKLTRDEYTFVC